MREYHLGTEIRQLIRMLLERRVFFGLNDFGFGHAPALISDDGLLCKSEG